MVKPPMLSDGLCRIDASLQTDKSRPPNLNRHAIFMVEKRHRYYGRRISENTRLGFFEHSRRLETDRSLNHVINFSYNTNWWGRKLLAISGAVAISLEQYSILPSHFKTLATLSNALLHVLIPGPQHTSPTSNSYRPKVQIATPTSSGSSDHPEMAIG